MGKYNDAYENYYSRIISNENKVRRMDRAGRVHKEGKLFYRFGKFEPKRAINIFIFQLAGTFVLFALIFFCKMTMNSRTERIYSYAKETSSYTTDYKAVIQNVRNFDYKGIYSKAEEYIEVIKSKYFDDNGSIEAVSKNFEAPVNGKILCHFQDGGVQGVSGYKDGIVIEVPEGTAVKACGPGTVREAGESSELGKYVIIDHGSGIETQYGNLDTLDVKKGDSIEKDSMIGNSGGCRNLDSTHVFFEIIYMGEPKDPEMYMNFSNQSL